MIEVKSMLQHASPILFKSKQSNLQICNLESNRNPTMECECHLCCFDAFKKLVRRCHPELRQAVHVVES